MASETNVKINGVYRYGDAVQALVDQTSAIVSSDNNLGIHYGMAFQSTSTGSFLQLTVDNGTAGTNTLGYNTPGLVPQWGSARNMFITASAGLVTTVKCYCIDLNGDEKIVYVTTNGTNNIITGTTSPSGTGGTSVSLTTGLRHINRMEDISPRNSGFVYVKTVINGITTTLVLISHYYQYNPIYCCPNGRRAKFKGFQMISASAQNDYEIVIYKKSADTSIFSGHPVSFPYRFRINDFSALSQNLNNYQWSDNGLVTIEQNDWLFLNRETGGTQINLNAYATIVEYKV